MKLTKEQFNKKVELAHNGEFEVIGHFKGLVQPILVKDKYGLLQLKSARQIFGNRPSILSAVNKTEYFMNMLYEAHPNIHDGLKPLGEYSSMKENMMFDTQYGPVVVSPDSLIHGHIPNIRSAVNRKKYFKNQLLAIYGDLYDFKVSTSCRRTGKTILICKEHGEVIVDNDHIFLGKGCYRCNNTPSDVFYILKMKNDNQEFYKLGVSYLSNGKIRRISDYERMGYVVEEIFVRKFDCALSCRELETKLKRIIKPYLIVPLKWDYKTSTECFDFNIKTFIDCYINNDIV